MNLKRKITLNDTTPLEVIINCFKCCNYLITEDGDWIVSEAYDTSVLDVSDDSSYFESQGDSILDFTERNPFGEVT